MTSGDVSRVLSWFESGSLLRPDAETPSSVHLARVLANCCGAQLEESAPERTLSEAIGRPDHLIFVLADGLGLNLLEKRPEGSFLRRHVALALRSVFPSSTAPALTSLATGLWPAEHGLPAWFVYLPEVRKQVVTLPFVERFKKRPLEELGLDPHMVLPSPVLRPLYRRDVRSFQPRRISGSTYTRYIQDGEPGEPYDKLADGVNLVLSRVRAAKEPSFSYLYYPSIDTCEHTNGPAALQTRVELDKFEANIERLAAGVAGKARIVISADHGLYDVALPQKLMVKPEDELSELLVTPPAGEPRVPIFHCRLGNAVEFQRRFNYRFGESIVLLTPDEVEELQLMGPAPLSPQTRARLGDFIGIANDGAAIVYEPDKEIVAMKGFHGGLSPEEVRIPLVVI